MLHLWSSPGNRRPGDKRGIGGARPDTGNYPTLHSIPRVYTPARAFNWYSSIYLYIATISWAGLWHELPIYYVRCAEWWWHIEENEVRLPWSSIQYVLTRSCQLHYMFVISYMCEGDWYRCRDFLKSLERCFFTVHQYSLIWGWLASALGRAESEGRIHPTNLWIDSKYWRSPRFSSRSTRCKTLCSLHIAYRLEIIAFRLRTFASRAETEAPYWMKSCSTSQAWK